MQPGKPAGVWGFILKCMRILHSLPCESVYGAHIPPRPTSNSTSEAARVCVFILGLFLQGLTVSPCRCALALQWEHRHRWWRDTEGAVVPSAVQEASVAHAEEGLVGRARARGGPGALVGGESHTGTESGEWGVGTGEASKVQTHPHSTFLLPRIQDKR